jgi:hypothetical protein
MIETDGLASFWAELLSSSVCATLLAKARQPSSRVFTVADLSRRASGWDDCTGSAEGKLSMLKKKSLLLR